MKNDQRLLEWPQGGLTRAPFRVMSDPEIYAQEQERIFRGPVRNYLCLEAEIADPNRCAHKGALLCPAAGGSAVHGEFARSVSRHDSSHLLRHLQTQPSDHGWHTDLSLIERRQEFDDGITVAIQSIFPSCVHQQIYNTLAMRQLVPQDFGYQDDHPVLRQMRLKQKQPHRSRRVRFHRRRRDRRICAARHCGEGRCCAARSTRFTLATVNPSTKTSWRNLVVRARDDGAMTLYSPGVYLDKVVLNGEGARFEERIVVPDSRRIETLLVIPL